MTAETHAFLPAHKIVDACDRVKRRIKQERDEIARDVARAMRRTRPWLWFVPISQIITRMPEEIKAITREHCFLQEGAIDDIRALASAVVTEGEDFQVVITANDFYLLKDHYRS
jgi:hypothetical protein